MIKHPALRSFVTVLVAAVSLASLPNLVRAQAGGDAPTKEIVEQVLKSGWDKAASSLNAKAVLTLNSIKMGPATKATVQQVQVDGLPEGAMVTPAVVDFTVRTYYTGETQALRRVREAIIYKDKMGEWAVVTGAVKGEDVRTKEPAGG